MLYVVPLPFHSVQIKNRYCYQVLPVHDMKAPCGVVVYLQPCLTSATVEVWGQFHTLAALSPCKASPVPI